MAKQLSNPAFDYSQLTKDDKGKLTYFEGELIRSRKRVAEEVVKHGEILHGVQLLFADYAGGVFTAWLESVGISVRSAYNAIDAFLGFASFANLQNLEVSAMYALAKNEKAKKQALRLADKGTKVTHAMAKELLARCQERVKTSTDDLIGEDDWSATDLPQEPAPTPPRNGTDQRGEACPNCGATEWIEDDLGQACASCKHPHGEPIGDIDPGIDGWKTHRAKAVKTCEALVRAIDDLHQVKANRVVYTVAVEKSQEVLLSLREW